MGGEEEDNAQGQDDSNKSESGVNPILNTLVGNYNRQQQSLTPNDMSSYNFGLSPEDMIAFDDYKRSSVPTGPLAAHDYFPGFNGGGAVGNYSGSIIGSASLFGGGGALVPFGIYDAQQAAIDKASMDKAREVDAFRDKLNKGAPTSKLTNINDDLTKGYFTHIHGSFQKALKRAGGNSYAAMHMLQNDPEFQAKTKGFEDRAKLGNSIVEKTAQDEQDRRTGKFNPLPSYIAAHHKLYKALDSNNPEFKDLANTYHTLQLERDFSDSLDHVMKNAFANEQGYSNANLNDPEFIKIYEGSKKEWSPEQVEGFTNVLKDDIYHGSDYWTLDKIKKNVQDALRGQVVKKDTHITQRREPDANDNYSDSDISKEPSSTNVFTRNQNGAGGTTSVAPGVVEGDFGVTHKKPINTIIPNGAHVYINDEKNGLLKTSEVNPNAKVQLFKTQLMKVYDGSAKEHEGTPISAEQIKAGRKWKWVPMTTGVSTEKDEDGNVVQKQIFVPTKEVENTLVKSRDKSGQVEKGIPVDKLYNEADKRNADLKPNAKSDNLRKKYNY